MAEQRISKTPTVPRYVTCACAHCDGKIEFDANGLAEGETRTAPCPHCRLETTLFVTNDQRVPPAIPPMLREDGTQLDPASLEMLKWYRKAAELGDAEDQFQWAGALASGLLGVAKDFVEAAKWFRKAAEQGHPTAQFNVGACYWNGQGVTKDHAEGVKWFLKAAGQGDADSQKVLGQCYEQGDGVAQDLVEACRWMALAAVQNHAGAQEKCDQIASQLTKGQLDEANQRGDLTTANPKKDKEPVRGKSDNTFLRLLRKVAASGDGEAEMLLASLRAAHMTPDTFSCFVGQERLKARLQMATAAAKQRHEAIDHILLVGPPGSGKATLAHIVARTMGANLKSTSGLTIEKAGDLAGLLTNLEEGDVLFIDEIHRLRRTIAEYLFLAMKAFKLDVVIDQGSDARSVRLNLPRFTLVGTTPRKEPLTTALLSCFPIIEKMDAYCVAELAAITCRFAESLEVEIDAETAQRIARSADGTPLDVLNRLRHVRDYTQTKANGKITTEIVAAALNLLPPAVETIEVHDDRASIPSEVRREVWRRDGGKCVRCGSRERLEYDHIIPVTRGGSNTARNIELLCETCNRAKSDLIQ
jgi:Holliday junction DNA helicase RuvB subunit